MGNCFYEAVVDQMELLKHDFLRDTPADIEHHVRLRGIIQGEFFKIESGPQIKILMCWLVS